MQKISLKVSGMVCQGCENRIKNTLKDIDSVKSVNADFKKGIVTVNAKEDCSLNKLISAIENLGFEVLKIVSSIPLSI